jgi:hypothetical protein
MKNIPYYFVLSLLLSLFSCSNTESGCGSVDECISSYDFEGARKFIGENWFDKDEDIKKITIAESKYWADKGDIDKALTVIDETWGIEDSEWSEADWQSWRYNIIDKGVASFCEKSEYKQAKILALKAADDINVDGFKIGSDLEEYDRNNNHVKAKGPSMRESLLKKINEYETLLN